MKTLDAFIEGVTTQETKKRLQTHAELIPFLSDPHSSLECEEFNIDQLIEGLAGWVKSSNFKLDIIITSVTATTCRGYGTRTTDLLGHLVLLIVCTRRPLLGLRILTDGTQPFSKSDIAHGDMAINFSNGGIVVKFYTKFSLHAMKASHSTDSVANQSNFRSDVNDFFTSIGVCGRKGVSLNGLEVLCLMVDRMGENFKPHVTTVLPAVVDRLGDSKDQVRDMAQQLLLKLMMPASTPQYVFDRLGPAFTHKLWHVKEGVLLTLQNTINRQVREAATNSLVEIYRHVGEKVRMDLKKLGLSQQRMNMLNTKFEELKISGNMLPTADIVGGCAGLWTQAVVIQWLRWAVDPGCGHPVAALGCGPRLWSSSDCAGLWTQAMVIQWLHWAVDPGCGHPVATLGCGPRLWSSSGCTGLWTQAVVIRCLQAGLWTQAVVIRCLRWAVDPGCGHPVATLGCGPRLWSSSGCTGLWTQAVVIRCLRWAVDPGCGHPVAALGCGPRLWSSSGCTGLWTQAVVIQWLHWAVDPGCGHRTPRLSWKLPTSPMPRSGPGVELTDPSKIHADLFVGSQGGEEKSTASDKISLISSCSSHFMACKS
ncbi:hypothetical protein Btru_051059 [Bulinus truncatus]|nr:hypothetical protein Btru_051059 [Bulinus truncatus]